MSYRNQLAIAMIAASLGACGGSDSSSGNDTRTVADPIPTSVLTTSESSTIQRNLTESFGELSGQITDENDLLTGRLANGTLELTVGEVDRPITTVVDILDENGKAVATLKVLVENNSASSQERALELLSRKREALLKLQELKGLHKLIVDAAYLGSEITADGQATMLAEFNPSELSRYAKAESDLDEALSEFSRYQEGAIGEDQLDPEAVIDELNFLAQEGYVLIQTTAESVNSPLSVPQNYELMFNDENETLSRFVGQPDLGSWASGQWSYHSAYQHLSLLN